LRGQELRVQWMQDPDARGQQLREQELPERSGGTKGRGTAQEGELSAEPCSLGQARPRSRYTCIEDFFAESLGFCDYMSPPFGFKFSYDLSGLGVFLGGVRLAECPRIVTFCLLIQSSIGECRSCDRGGCRRASVAGARAVRAAAAVPRGAKAAGAGARSARSAASCARTSSLSLRGSAVACLHPLASSSRLFRTAGHFLEGPVAVWPQDVTFCGLIQRSSSGAELQARRQQERSSCGSKSCERSSCRMEKCEGSSCESKLLRDQQLRDQVRGDR